MQLLDKVDDTSCCTTTGAWVLTEQKTVKVLQLQFSNKVLTCPLLRRQVHWVPHVQLRIWTSHSSCSDKLSHEQCCPQIQFIAGVCRHSTSLLRRVSWLDEGASSNNQGTTTKEQQPRNNNQEQPRTNNRINKQLCSHFGSSGHCCSDNPL